MALATRNICIIGGGGFIGTALRQYLVLQGYTLYTIGRSLNIPMVENEQYYSVAEYSFKQLEELLSHKDFYAIIDLAYTSVPNTSYDDPIKDFTENLYIVIRHLDFAKVVGTHRFVYVSSGGTVYGDSGQRLPFKEDSPNAPLSPYGITKLACEHYVNMYHRLHALPTLIIRPSNMYGPGQKPFRGQGLIATALGLVVKGDPIHVFGDGSHVRDYLHISDFCAGLMNVINHGTDGDIYNIGSAAGITIKELITTINSVLEPEGSRLQQETYAERPFDVHYNVLNTGKLMQLTGWHPQVPLNQGLAQTWQWIKEYMKVNP